MLQEMNRIICENESDRAQDIIRRTKRREARRQARKESGRDRKWVRASHSEKPVAS